MLVSIFYTLIVYRIIKINLPYHQSSEIINHVTIWYHTFLKMSSQIPIFFQSHHSTAPSVKLKGERRKEKVEMLKMLKRMEGGIEDTFFTFAYLLFPLLQICFRPVSHKGHNRQYCITCSYKAYCQHFTFDPQFT